MPKLDKHIVEKGRKAVYAYRDKHIKLHEKGWRKGLSEEHTPLLEDLISDLEKCGFASLDEFFSTSELLNIEELGYSSWEDFNKRATKEDKDALDRMWM